MAGAGGDGERRTRVALWRLWLARREQAGELYILADYRLLATEEDQISNLVFIRNLARYAHERGK